MTTSADAAIARALVDAGVATLHEALGRGGLCTDIHLMVGPTFAGRAATVAIPAGDNLGIHAVLETAPAGSVICIASDGVGRFGVIGELILTAARARGVAGFAIDDGIRDLDLLIPPPSVAARSVTARGTIKERFAALGQPITLAGIAVSPGDWVVGDHDGVCIIPAGRIDEVLAAARNRAARESEMRGRLAAGATTVEVLGLAELIKGGGDKP
jgi:4-hydroxy-4-methyl-2-oxoglutarate aldolase